MKKLLAIFALVLLLGACAKKEFTVQFDVSGNADIRPYTLVYYASAAVNARVTETVVQLQKGKAQTLCQTVHPTLLWIMPSGRPASAIPVYARRGDKILVTGKDDNPLLWRVSGNKINDRLTEWRLANRKAFEARSLDPQKGAEQINAAVAKFVSENPDNPVSTILLTCFYDRRLNPDGFSKSWSLLKDDALEAQWRDLASPGDLLSQIPESSKLPASILLSTAETGCDTIRTGRVPVLLLFSKLDRDSHSRDIDSLRSLLRQFPDSSSRVIADISFDPDSANRFMRARRDSLKGDVRAWMPLGVSDMTARELGVTRAPYAIVIDKSGKTAYRGSDTQIAFSTFRKLLKK